MDRRTNMVLTNMFPKDSPHIFSVRMKEAISEYEYLPVDPHGVDHSGRAVYGMNCLLPLEHWDRGFESHSRH
jgi:hypothetical protein